MNVTDKHFLIPGTVYFRQASHLASKPTATESDHPLPKNASAFVVFESSKPLLSLFHSRIWVAPVESDAILDLPIHPSESSR